MLRKSRIVAFSGALFLVLVSVAAVIPNRHAFAASISNESLTLEDGATDGGSLPSGVVKHLFTFKIPTTGTTIHSIQFEYCKAYDGACVEPTGLVTTNATLGTQTGMNFDSVVANPSGTPPGVEGSPYLTSAAGINVTAANQNVSFELDNITNPDGTDCAGTSGACTFYVRIATFVTTDATGSPTDTGEVAASTTQKIVLNGVMPESLVFCTGGSISLNAGNSPDCTTATSGSVNFNQDFSPSDTAYAISQMAASTNAGAGYAITVGGATLTNGSYTINAMGATAAQSTWGVSQFGMNLAENNGTPLVLYSHAPDIPPSYATDNPNPTSDGTDYFANPTANFANDDLFAFDDTGLNIVAKSDYGGTYGTPGTLEPTNGQIYTVSYIANVPGRQPAGTYTTTLTYICTPTF